MHGASALGQLILLAHFPVHKPGPRLGLDTSHILGLNTCKSTTQVVLIFPSFPPSWDEAFLLGLSPLWGVPPEVLESLPSESYQVGKGVLPRLPGM